ncbi:MAG: hypothetical protein K940chlam3_00965 [Chlamydiae bacterium]|nr:hypothetical protein [Chlamydiota bacterium]
MNRIFYGFCYLGAREDMHESEVPAEPYLFDYQLHENRFLVDFCI